MNLTQLITCAFLFNAIIMYQAGYQAKRFRQNKPISHIGKELIYGIACSVIGLCFLYGRWQEIFWYWQVPLLASMQRLASFDLILNHLRHNAWYYVGRGTTGSIQSKIEGKLSDYWVKRLKIAFIVLWVASIWVIIWYHLKHEG